MKPNFHFWMTGAKISTFHLLTWRLWVHIIISNCEYLNFLFYILCLHMIPKYFRINQFKQFIFRVILMQLVKGSLNWQRMAWTATNVMKNWINVFLHFLNIMVSNIDSLNFWLLLKCSFILKLITSVGRSVMKSIFVQLNDETKMLFL